MSKTVNCIECARGTGCPDWDQDSYCTAGLEKRTRRVKIWGRWMQGRPSYMTTEYNPETKAWELIDMNIHATLKEVKQILCQMYPDYAFIRMSKIENDIRDYWGHPRDTHDAWRGFRN